jgi:Flp pilus assembly pilin Flp
MIENPILRFFREERGATAIEYAFIAMFIGIALAASMPTIRNSLQSLFSQLSNKLETTF